MKFDTPAGRNPIDRMAVIGQPLDRIDGVAKTTGVARYAYEHHAEAPAAAYGYVVGSAIAKGSIATMDLTIARAAPGVIAVVTAETAAGVRKGKLSIAPLLGGPKIDHYAQAIALIVAETFEQARAAAALIRVEYVRQPGKFDLATELPNATKPSPEGVYGESDSSIGNFARAFDDAPIRVDQTYTTPDQSHAMMEPQASTAIWEDGKLTVWTSTQMVDACRTNLADTLSVSKDKVRLISPYVGGGFGSKLYLRTDAVMAALGARATNRAVKVALTRPMLMNNTSHRPATIQRIRIGADRAGRISAIAHESWSGNLPGGNQEPANAQTRLLYAGANRLIQTRLAVLDLPEGNSMRAPGEAPGLMALEIAMDELAERLGMDPVEVRIVNDTQVDPEKPDRPFSRRELVRCLKEGAERFGWHARDAKPGAVREGHWLIGMGVASAFRNNQIKPSGARVRLDGKGMITVETDMTDIGTGSYTIIAQTAAEMMGVPIDRVSVQLGDSAFPVSSGSGGQWGANSATAGVYAACTALRDAVAQRLGFNTAEVRFESTMVKSGTRAIPLAEAARAGDVIAEDTMEYGTLDKTYQQSTFGAHFVEVAVNSYTGEIRIRRMLAVCAAGRILNPKTARSQVIGAMTMGIGGALMEELAVDKRFGFFVNHDLAGYEVPVHADVPHQQVVFLEEVDPMSSPMKAKGVGELGLCGVGAAVANAVYNATGVRVRDYPITMDKFLDKLPRLA